MVSGLYTLGKLVLWSAQFSVCSEACISFSSNRVSSFIVCLRLYTNTRAMSMYTTERNKHIVWASGNHISMGVWVGVSRTMFFLCSAIHSLDRNTAFTWEVRPLDHGRSITRIPSTKIHWRDHRWSTHISATTPYQLTDSARPGVLHFTSLNIVTFRFTSLYKSFKQNSR